MRVCISINELALAIWSVLYTVRQQSPEPGRGLLTRPTLPTRLLLVSFANMYEYVLTLII